MLEWARWAGPHDRGDKPTHVLGVGAWYARVTDRRGWDRAIWSMAHGPMAGAAIEYARRKGLA